MMTTLLSRGFTSRCLSETNGKTNLRPTYESEPLFTAIFHIHEFCIMDIIRFSCKFFLQLQTNMIKKINCKYSNRFII